MNRPAGTLALAAAALLAACSPKDAAKRDSTKVTQAGANAAAPASRGTFDPATHTATIYAKDYAFEAPDSVSAGLTTFRLVNDGKALHHVQLVRLDSGKTAADLEAAMKNPGPPPAFAVFVGGPNAPDPNTTAEATFDVKEGNYVLVCFVDIPEHVPHFAKGMVKPLKVTAASGTPAAAPTADVTIALSDYSFAIKGNLTAGKHVLKVDNAGPQVHEIEIIRLAPGKTMKDLGAWMQKMEGPPPANAIGGIAGMITGTSGYTTVDLTPGNYVAVCFIPDAKDGKGHLEHGMIKEFVVK